MANHPSSEDLFAQALEHPSPGERESFLERVCGGNAALRRELATLLQAHEEAGGFLAEVGASASTLCISPLNGRAGDAADMPPRIGGFRVERKLGSGGLGVVYEAWDEKLQRKVALKTLHALPDAQMRRRVLDEARKTAALRDPAIVTVHAVLDDHEPPAIVMELVEGVPLDRYASSLSHEQKARILQEIARALSVAHRGGIIHRDLKPANVLLTPAMRPIILDFGLAISVGETANAGSFEGTALYASPEQAMGKPLTAASDVFSFGSLMFNLLTGTTPFTGADMMEVLRAICSAEPPFLRDVAVGVPLDLQAICLACLAREPGGRPTAEQIAVDLGRFLASEPVRLRPALYGDILRRRISEYSSELASWEEQGMISRDEKDRLQVVHRRILADEDHWLIDARRLTTLQTVLYTSTWLVVIAAGLLVWLARHELSPAWRSALPVFAAGALIAAGFLAQRRGEALASASFLAGAVLSLLPATLTIVADWHWWAQPMRGVQQLFPDVFTNQQVLVACVVAFLFSIFALLRLRMTGFAWTTAVLGAATYVGLLLQWNWLGQKPEFMALWLLPLTLFSIAGVAFEKISRIRWALPFYLVALLTLVGSLDVMAGSGPTLRMCGLNQGVSAYFNEHRLNLLSFALNGVLFLVLMFATENSRSLDLRRGSRLLEILAMAHLLGALYANAEKQRDDAHVLVDVALYLGVVLLFLLLGPPRSRWRMLVGALSGLALGSYLLVDLRLVPKVPFICAIGAAGLLTMLGAYLYLIRTRVAAAARSDSRKDRGNSTYEVPISR